MRTVQCASHDCSLVNGHFFQPITKLPGESGIMKLWPKSEVKISELIYIIFTRFVICVFNRKEKLNPKNPSNI